MLVFQRKLLTCWFSEEGQCPPNTSERRESVFGISGRAIIGSPRMPESGLKRFWNAIKPPPAVPRRPSEHSPTRSASFWEFLKTAARGRRALRKRKGHPEERRRRKRLVVGTAAAILIAGRRLGNICVHRLRCPSVPETVAPSRAEAFARMAQGKYQEAVERFTKATDIWPPLAAGYFERGLAHRDLHQTDAAVQDFEQAIECGSQTSRTLTRRSAPSTASEADSEKRGERVYFRHQPGLGGGSQLSTGADVRVSGRTSEGPGRLQPGDWRVAGRSFRLSCQGVDARESGRCGGSQKRSSKGRLDRASRPQACAVRVFAGQIDAAMFVPLTPLRCLHRAVDVFGSKTGVVSGGREFTSTLSSGSVRSAWRTVWSGSASARATASPT